MKIFVLAVGDRSRASSRLRVWDHVDWLRQCGHEVRACYVLPPGITSMTVGAALRILLHWPSWIWNLLWADRVVVQETLLLSPFLWLARVGKGRRVVFDFSDPIDMLGRGLRNRLQRLGFACSTGLADHVLVENQAYLEDFRRRGIAASQFYGPVDVDRYQQGSLRARAVREPGRALRIGWTGSPGTLAFILPILPSLDRLAERHRIRLTLIGVNKVDYAFQRLPIELLPWSEESEFEEVPDFDLGLFALDGSEQSRRRGAGKLFVYMAAGVPFVATGSGIARDVMEEAGSGFSVDSPERWESRLESAIVSDAERREMVRSGVTFAEQRASYRVYRKLLARVLAIDAPATVREAA